jgi:hypothetical protein
MVLFEELMGLEGLADKRRPVNQAGRFLHVASDDPHRWVAAAAGRLDVLLAGVFPHLIGVFDLAHDSRLA